MIITLLTDLGTEDNSVAAAKADIAKALPDAAVVDITHRVSRHNWREAAYLLSVAYESFPPGTVHIVPVSVFGERQPRMIFAEKDGHYFIAPDNGLLPVALGNEIIDNAVVCHRYAKPWSFSAWILDAASIAKAITTNSRIPGDVVDGERGFTVPPPLPAPQVTPFSAVCRILYADRYDNIVLNITENEFREITNKKLFKIRTFKGQNITTVSQHYNDVAVGEPLCRINKAGYLEIAVNHGSAMDLFGFEPGDSAALEYQTVRIYFT